MGKIVRKIKAKQKPISNKPVRLFIFACLYSSEITFSFLKSIHGINCCQILSDECWIRRGESRLDTESFQEIMLTRPELADVISEILAQRQAELESAAENLDSETRKSNLANAHSNILAQIRTFFGLSSLS